MGMVTQALLIFIRSKVLMIKTLSLKQSLEVLPIMEMTFGRSKVLENHTQL